MEREIMNMTEAVQYCEDGNAPQADAYIQCNSNEML